MFQYVRIIYCRHVLKAFLPLLTRFYYKYLSVNIGFITLFSSFDMHQSHHLVGPLTYLTNNAFSKNICR